MKKLIAIGEALIDFISAQTGRLQDVASFEPHVGGAPCNVCGAFARLGGTSAMITQLGQDGFGDKIISELNTYGVDTAMIERTSEANPSGVRGCRGWSAGRRHGCILPRLFGTGR